MWKENNDCLSKVFKFRNFTEAFGFMTQVALVAEKNDHHPDWNNSYNVVEITLTTHSAGKKVTEKDHRLAKEIDLIYGIKNQ